MPKPKSMPKLAKPRTTKAAAKIKMPSLPPMGVGPPPMMAGPPMGTNMGMGNTIPPAPNPLLEMLKRKLGGG